MESNIPSGRPAFHFQLEMGASWQPKDSRRKSYQLTCMSKNAWGRIHHPISQTYQPHYCSCHQRHREQQNRSRPYPIHDQHSLPGSASYPQHQQPPQEHLELSQPRRLRTLLSHDHGHSAPPPLQSNPWEIEPEPMMATALPSRVARPHAYKTTPPTPGNFRLGGKDMPWSPSPFPMDGVSESSSPLSLHADREIPAQPVDDQDQGRTMEIQSLATALMTVDNGFEDQWWYQGTRLVNIAGDLISPAAVAERYAQCTQYAIGTVISPISERGMGVETWQHFNHDEVSPSTTFSSPLRRTLTTRSEELHTYI